jgi:EEF1A lysine methyltransferase 1
VVLLEHDNRFAVFPEFVYYDFAQPMKLPAELKGACDRIIVDPPFLSEDCQTKGMLHSPITFPPPLPPFSQSDFTLFRFMV